MRINCHAHVFNLKALLTKQSLEIVRDRMEREIQPEFLGKIVGELLADLVEDLANFDEEQILRDLLRRITKSTPIGGLLDGTDLVPEALRPVLNGGKLEKLALKGLLRGVDALIGLLRRRGDDDITKKSLFSVIDLLRTVAGPDIPTGMGRVAERLMGQLGPDEGAILLTLDVTADNADRDVFEAQLAATSGLIRRYPGRVFPFYGLNPLRSGTLQRLEKAVQEEGYVGVKIYPSSGWAVDHKDMPEVYSFCHSHQLPILMHCNRGGFYGPGSREEMVAFADPAHWRPILEEHPGLKICFAHFGGGGGITKTKIPDDHWAGTILELMEAHEGVYADLAAHSAPTKNLENRESYFGNLKDLLAHPTFRDRILFGTDWWMMRVRLTEARHWRFYEENLTETEFTRIAADNPWRFLGLPDGTADAAPAVKLYADLILREAAKPEGLDGPVPPWLLDFIEEEKDAETRKKLELAGERFLPAPGLIVPSWAQGLQLLTDAALSAKSRHDFSADEISLFDQQSPDSSIRLTGKTGLSVELFKDDDPKDEDSILAVPPFSRPHSALQLRPAIKYSPQHRWFKYRLEGELGLAAAKNFDAFGLDVKADAGLVLTDYRRRHDASVLNLAAIASDLSRPRFALRLNDVLRLGHGEAVSYSVRGNLAAEASASWADLLTGGLGAVSKVLGATVPLVVRLDVGATVSARITLTDNFRVVFSRRLPLQGSAEGTLRRRAYGVGITKLKAKGKELKFAVNATLQFDDQEVVKAILTQVLAQALGELNETMGRLLGVAGEGEFKSDPKLLTRLEERLEVTGRKAVKKRIGELEKDALEGIEQIARAKLEAGFSYEYSRLATDTTLLEARLSEEALVEHHHRLAGGDFAGLLARVAPGVNDREVKVDRYVVERRVEKRRAWGFTLGSAISGRDIVESAFVEQEARLADDEETVHKKRVSFLGAREYRGKWVLGPKKWRWRVDFNAQMPGFSASPELKASEFDYGFAFLFEWTFNKLGSKKLDLCLDAADLWGVFGAADADLDSVRARFEDLMGQKVKLKLELVFDPTVVAEMLPQAAVANPETIGRALGQAMPYRDDSMRGNPKQRGEVYGELWRTLIEEDEVDPSPSRINALAVALHEKHRGDFPHESKQEILPVSQKFMWTLTGMLSKNTATIRHWKDFLKGFGRVLEAKSGGAAPAEDVKTMHQEMEGFWSQSHQVRALGAYLLAQADSQGLQDQVKAGLRAEVKKGEEFQEALVL